MEKKDLKISQIINRLYELSDDEKMKDQIKLVSEDLNLFLNRKKEAELESAGEIAEILLNETGTGIISVITAIIFVLNKHRKEHTDSLEKKYNNSVKKLFKGLSNVPDIKSEKTEKQTDNFIKLLLTITDDVRAILILISIQIYKMRRINLYDDKDITQILNLSKNIYIPLAHRIGLYNIKTELEEIHMKHTETDMYKLIAGKLKETKANRDLYINQFIEPLKILLKDAGYRFTIKGRPKSIHSIWNKMKNKEVSFEEVYDLFAIRIILKSDLKNEKIVCWNVYSLITNIYKPNPKRLRDWISSPKLSGYESLHTTVLGPENKWAEVQIRTERMDEIAEKGPAAHWRYKTGKEGGGKDWLAKIRDEIENPSNTETNDNAKTSLYSDDILVFTPENDLKSLKKGYTILDFAFAVHSKVGETCTGAIVNGKIQALTYELQNGDTVKILTNKNKKPNPEWLEIAKGQRTKNKIKRALKSITFEAADIGKELLKEKVERLKLTFNDTAIQKIANYFNFKTALELFHHVGKGTVDLQKIKYAFENEEVKQYDNDVISVNNQIDTIKEISQPDDYLIIGDNLSGLDYKLAKCCNPLPGDKIFGFVTVNKGTKIHKSTCPNAKEMHSRFPYRIVKAKWNKIDSNNAFSATIFINGSDKSGLTSEVTKIITEEFNMKLHAISLKSDSYNQFSGVVIVLVNNRKQLNDLIKRLKIIKGMRTVGEKINSN